MMRCGLPVFVDHDDLEELLKKDREPKFAAYTRTYVKDKDGNTVEKWYAVSPFSAGQAWCEAFGAEIECLAWLILEDVDEDDVPYFSDREIDDVVRELWNVFGDIPMNPESEEIEEPFLRFEAGTHREVIWHWFDEVYSKGVHELMYEEEKHRDTIKKILDDLYGGEFIEDSVVYVCYCIVDCEDSGIHTDHMEVLRCLSDVAKWWMERETDLEKDEMFPIERDTISWMRIITNLKNGSEEANMAVYAWINENDYDPLNCVQIIVEKHEIK